MGSPHMGRVQVFLTHASGMFCTMAVDFSLHGLSFFNYMPQAYFDLHLRCNGVLLTWVRFFRIIHLGYILSCAFVVVDFSSCESGFPDSYISGIFCLVPLVVGFFSCKLGFPNMCIGHILPNTFVVEDFFSRESNFFNMHLMYILPCAFVVVDFYSCGSGFHDSRASSTFCLLSLS